MSGDRKRGHNWGSPGTQTGAGIKKKKNPVSTGKDTITPDLRNPAHVGELQWLYKKELKKHGLKGA